MLCRACHDRVEGLPFTPNLIESERRRIKGAKDTAAESYVFLVHDDCIIFAGIRIHDELVPFNMVFPREQPLRNAQVALDMPSPPAPESLKKPVPKINPRDTSRGRGRPPMIIPARLAKILDEDISLSEKVKMTGLAKTTIHRYLKHTRTIKAGVQG